MTTRPGLMTLGLLAGVAIAGWLIKRDADGEDTNVLDEVLDWLVENTTSEEARIAKMEPVTAVQFRILLTDWARHGLQVHVGQTLRTPAKEKALQAEGKTSANLKHSWHTIGRAVDVYPIIPETGKADLDGKRVDLFKLMHDIAAARGWRGIAFNADGTKRLITNSKGKKIWDGGHLEWRSPYDTIAQAVQAEGAQYGIA